MGGRGEKGKRKKEKGGEAGELVLLNTKAELRL
jgi:hypothetical protein